MTHVLLMSLICALLGIFSFIKIWKHLLNVLISLEFLVLMIFFIIVCQTYILVSMVYVCLVFLVFSVCEGALGLTILVSMARSFGVDYFSSFSLIL